MTPTQKTAVIFFALTAAVSIMFFNRGGRSYKRSSGILAWLIFCQMACLVVSVSAGAEKITQWLLIGSLAVHSINIVLAKGNINKVRPHIPLFGSKTDTEENKAKPHIRSKKIRSNHHA